MMIRIIIICGVISVSSLPGQSVEKSFECPGRPDLCDVFFLNSLEGWVVGDSGTILHSSNGGNSWVLQPGYCHEVLHAVSFVNSREGWICGEGGLILTTSTGGEKWEIQPSGTDRPLYDIQFIDADRGWAVGCSIILSTTDGGSLWAAKDFPFCTSLFTVHFINARHGWAVGGSRILHTSDGGNIWVQQPSPARTCLYAVAFTDSLYGWIAGDYGTILNTSDGGKNWRTISTGRMIWLNTIRFCRPSMGCAAGVIQIEDQLRGIILWTRDGGKTWQEQIYPDPLYAAAFLNQDEAWGAGEKGQLVSLNANGASSGKTPDF